MTSALTRMVARALLVPSLVVAVAILVKGYTDVGDGFAAGVVASLALMLQYLAFGRERVDEALPLRHAPIVALVGLIVAVAMLAIPLFAGDPPLTHQPPAGEKPGHVGSLELITAVVFDIGICLLVAGAVLTILRAVIVSEEAVDA